MLTPAACPLRLARATTRRKINARQSMLLATLIMSLGFAAPEQVSASPVIRLEDALAMAFASNPELAAAAWQTDIAYAERQQAGLSPNPQLSLQVEDTRSASRLTTLGLSLEIETNGKRAARLEVGRYGEELAAVELQRERNLLRANVIAAFFTALRAQEYQVLAARTLALAEKALSIAELLVKVGKTSPLDTDKAKLQLAEAGLEFDRATTQRAQNCLRLGALIDRSESLCTVQETTLPSLPELDFDRLLGTLPQTPDLLIAQRQVDRQEASLSLEKTERVGNITLGVASQYSRAERERINLLSVSVPLPLFNRNQGNILAAARRADQARDLRRSAELNMGSEARIAISEWTSSHQELITLKETVLPAAKVAVEKSLLGFEAGKFRFVDVLDTQRTSLDSQSRYLQALKRHADSWASLERLFGRMTP